MKKMLAIMLAIVVMVSLLTVNVAATGIKGGEMYKRNEIMEKACQVFPEYAAIIRTENRNTAYKAKSHSDKRLHVVREETRSAGPNRNITYTELSDGAVLLASYSFYYSDNTTHEPPHGGETKYTATIDVMCTASYGVFTLRNIKYTISDGYDKITSPGSPSVNDNDECFYHTNSVYDYDYKANETLHNPAYIMYKLTYHVRDTEPGYLYQTIFRFKLQNNSVKIETPVVE